MNVETYLLVAMLVMHVDAMVTSVSKIRYFAVGSLIAALLWPLTVPLVILFVAFRKDGDKEDAR